VDTDLAENAGGYRLLSTGVSALLAPFSVPAQHVGHGHQRIAHPYQRYAWCGPSGGSSTGAFGTSSSSSACGLRPPQAVSAWCGGPARRRQESADRPRSSGT